MPAAVLLDFIPAPFTLLALVAGLGVCLLLARLVLIAAYFLHGAGPREVDLLALGLRPDRRHAGPQP